MQKIKSYLKALTPSVRKPAVIYRHLLFIPFCFVFLTFPLWLPLLFAWIAFGLFLGSYQLLVLYDFDSECWFDCIKYLSLTPVLIICSLVAMYWSWYYIPSIVIGIDLLPQTILSHFSHNHSICQESLFCRVLNIFHL